MWVLGIAAGYGTKPDEDVLTVYAATPGGISYFTPGGLGNMGLDHQRGGPVVGVYYPPESSGQVFAATVPSDDPRYPGMGGLSYGPKKK